MNWIVPLLVAALASQAVQREEYEAQQEGRGVPAEPWLRVDESLQLEFGSDAVASQFAGTHGVSRQSVARARLEKSPVYETVVLHFHFTSNSALYLDLHDQFCAGQAYSVRDNDVFLAFNFPSLPTICGVSTTSLELIYSPQFMRARYPLAPGEHDLVIVVTGSRIGNRVSSMEVLLVPTGPIVIEGAPFLKMLEVSKKTIYTPPGTDIDRITP